MTKPVDPPEDATDGGPDPDDDQDELLERLGGLIEDRVRKVVDEKWSADESSPAKKGSPSKKAAPPPPPTSTKRTPPARPQTWLERLMFGAHDHDE